MPLSSSSNAAEKKSKKQKSKDNQAAAAAAVASAAGAAGKKSSERTKVKKAQDSQMGAAPKPADATAADESQLVNGALADPAEELASVASDSAASTSALVEITEVASFQALLSAESEQEEKKKKNSNKNLVLACFGAKWCRPCVVFAPKLELLARRFSQVAFVKINVDRMTAVADEYSVRAVPTFVLFKDGAKVGAVVANIEELLLTNGAQPSESKAIAGKAKFQGSKLKKD
uniref:Thioredoxin domain-containing protein n=1 Tax=Macrostomum lignano TaxID=282301 RepID=A0A1I8HXZ0_9PLAT